MSNRQNKYYKTKKGFDTELRRRYRQHQTATRDADGVILFPKDIVDEEAWIRYVELTDDLLTSDLLNYQTSDENLVINTTSTKRAIESKISHLPKQEQEKIYKLATQMRSLQSKGVQAKAKAFGRGVHSKESKAISPHNIHSDFFATKGSELLEWFGRYFTLQEVHKMITHEWRYQIGFDVLRRWRDQNIVKIGELQEEFKSKYTDVRLGHKRSRLDELSYLYQTRLDLYKDSKHREDSKELRAILAQVRQEVEGDVLVINGKIQHEHNVRIEEQVRDELMAGINLKALIIARVAERMGRNPLLLQYQLINSYYAKFTGFQRADEDINTDKIIYPSSLIYDFDDLRNKNKEIQAEDAEFVEMVEERETHGVPTDTEGLKEALMKKILERQELNRRSEAKVESAQISKEQVIQPKKRK